MHLGFKMSFDEFWAEYPLRKAKIAARTAYDKARKVASHEQIMAGVRRYKPKQGFCKHPATWLNQGCWDDDEPTIAIPVAREKWVLAERAFKCPDCLQITIGTECGYCRRATA